MEKEGESGGMFKIIILDHEYYERTSDGETLFKLP